MIMFGMVFVVFPTTRLLGPVIRTGALWLIELLDVGLYSNLIIVLAGIWMVDPLGLWMLNLGIAPGAVDRKQSLRQWYRNLGQRPPRIIRRWLAEIAVISLRQHIRSRLEALIVLHTSSVVSATLPTKERAALEEIIQQARTLKDGLPPKLTARELLSLPATITALLVVAGVLEKAAWPWYLSAVAGALCWAGAALVFRIKHLVLDLEIPVCAAPECSAASIYAIEARLFRSLGCPPPGTVRVDTHLERTAGVLVIAGGIAVLMGPSVTAGLPVVLSWALGVAAVLMLFLFLYLLIVEPTIDLKRRREMSF
jgi:hypothetical protein